MLQGFKEFISRGNAIDLAVGVIIGAAFTPIVTALTDHIFYPLIGALFGKPNFDSLWIWHLNGAVIAPFTVLTALVQFFVIAAALYFFVVTPMNALAARRKVEETEPEAPAEDVRVLTEIRDLLAARAGAESR